MPRHNGLLWFHLHSLKERVGPCQKSESVEDNAKRMRVKNQNDANDRHGLARELGRYSNFEWSRVVEDGCRFMRMARLYVVR